MNKALLILDIDETLIFASAKQLDYKEECKTFEFYVYIRPHLEHFLSELQKFYKLALWSSASDDYVEHVVANTLLNDFNYEFIWGRSRATFRRNFELDELRIYSAQTDHYHYVKPLKKVKRLGFSLKRVLIVDDSPHKSKLNYGNAIYPRVFEGQKDDDELLHLLNYLVKIKDHPNYRTLEKRGWRNQKNLPNQSNL